MTFVLEALWKSIRNSQWLCLLNVETREFICTAHCSEGFTVLLHMCQLSPPVSFAWQYKCLGSCMVCSLACVTSHSPASKPIGAVQVGGWSLSGESVSSVLIGCNVLAARQSYFTSKWLFWGGSGRFSFRGAAVVCRICCEVAEKWKFAILGSKSPVYRQGRLRISQGIEIWKNIFVNMCLKI